MQTNWIYILVVAIVSYAVWVVYSTISGIVEELKKYLIIAIDAVIEGFNIGVNATKEAYLASVAGIETGMQAVEDTVGSAVTEMGQVKDAVSTMASQVGGEVASIVTGLPETLSTAISADVSGMVSGLSSAIVDAVTDFL